MKVVRNSVTGNEHGQLLHSDVDRSPGVLKAETAAGDAKKVDFHKTEPTSKGSEARAAVRKYPLRQPNRKKTRAVQGIPLPRF